MTSMSTKTVLITGASRGIGLALASRFHAAGWNVIGAVRNPAAASQLQALKPFKIVQLDTSDEASVQCAAREVHGVAVDVLINNAGIQVAESLETMTKESMLRQYEVNTVGPFLVSRALLPCLTSAVSANGAAKLVHITSSFGSIGSYNGNQAPYPGYRSSKAGLNMLNANLAFNLKSERITSVVLCPGHVATSLNNYRGFLKPEESAAGLFRVIQGLKLSDTGKFIDYTGAKVVW